MNPRTAAPHLYATVNLWFFCVAGVAFAADQVSKRLIESQLTNFSPAIPVVWHWLEILRTQNSGAAFSLLQSGGVLFGIVAVIVSGAILILAPVLPTHERLLRVSLGLILGGAVGNLIDRVRQGYVTDWIHFQIPEIGFDFPVWNVADGCVVIGVILMIILNIISDRRRKPPDIFDEHDKSPSV